MTRRPRRSRRSLAVVATAALALLSACGYEGARSLPLPGAIGGDDTYRLTVVFTDATNLVPKETCRANDTVVGSVESVELDAYLQSLVEELQAAMRASGRDHAIRLRAEPVRLSTDKAVSVGVVVTEHVEDAMHDE